LLKPIKKKSPSICPPKKGVKSSGRAVPILSFGKREREIKGIWNGWKKKGDILPDRGEQTFEKLKAGGGKRGNFLTTEKGGRFPRRDYQKSLPLNSGGGPRTKTFRSHV